MFLKKIENKMRIKRFVLLAHLSPLHTNEVAPILGIIFKFCRHDLYLWFVSFLVNCIVSKSHRAQIFLWKSYNPCYFKLQLSGKLTYLPHSRHKSLVRVFIDVKYWIFSAVSKRNVHFFFNQVVFLRYIV